MSFTLSPIVDKPAREAGAVDGFESRCSCGLVMSSSLRTLLEADRVAHADWHARQAAKLAERELERAELIAERGPLLLVTTAQTTFCQHPGPDGEAVHPNLGRLVQPRHFPRVADTAAAGIPWAADNDCFQGLDEVAYTRMIDKLEGVEGCLFVTVPDVVGDAAATLELFVKWAPELERRGLPMALVAQDGLEFMRWAIEWDRIDCLFMGGTTEWKESAAARELADEARARGKWVHWGRVNTKRRFDLVVAEHGDSFDGSKFARFRKTYLDGGLEWARVANEERKVKAMPTYRFELDTRADTETDAAILAESLVGAVREESGDPDEPAAIRWRPIDGPDVAEPAEPIVDMLAPLELPDDELDGEGR